MSAQARHIIAKNSKTGKTEIFSKILGYKTNLDFVLWILLTFL